MKKFTKKKLMDISTLNEIVKKCQNFLGYVDWENVCREICIELLEDRNYSQIGGEGILW